MPMQKPRDAVSTSGLFEFASLVPQRLAEILPGVCMSWIQEKRKLPLTIVADFAVNLFEFEIEFVGLSFCDDGHQT